MKLIKQNFSLKKLEISTCTHLWRAHFQGSPVVLICGFLFIRIVFFQSTFYGALIFSKNCLFLSSIQRTSSCVQSCFLIRFTMFPIAFLAIIDMNRTLIDIRLQSLSEPIVTLRIIISPD